MYKVISKFADLHDKKRVYHEGDTYPRDGLNVSSARLAELSSNKNKIGKPLIKKVEDPKTEHASVEEEPIVERNKKRTKK